MNDVDALVGEWLTLPDVSERLGVPVTKVKQLIRDGELLAVPHGEREAPHIPAEFLQNGDVLRGLAGTLTLLRDAGYSDLECARWLFTPEDGLGESPVQALRQQRGKAVRRIAQTLGF